MERMHSGLDNRVTILENAEPAKEIVREVETIIKPKTPSPQASPAPAQEIDAVPMNVFLELKNYTYNYYEQNNQNVQDIRDHIKKHNERLNDLENQMDLLKSMSAPAGDDGKGLLDALQDIQDKLRKEFNEKLDNLLKRLESLEVESRDKDTDL